MEDPFYLNKTYNNGEFRDHPVPIYLDGAGRPYDEFGRLYSDSWKLIVQDAKGKLQNFKTGAVASFKTEVAGECKRIVGLK